jgi:hypothetical protein
VRGDKAGATSEALGDSRGPKGEGGGGLTAAEAARGTDPSMRECLFDALQIPSAGQTSQLFTKQEQPMQMHQHLHYPCDISIYWQEPKLHHSREKPISSELHQRLKKLPPMIPMQHSCDTNLNLDNTAVLIKTAKADT